MMTRMTKNLALDLTYDAPMAAVASMLADPAFRERVCDAQHATSRTVTVTGVPGQVEISMVRPTQGVPAFAKKMVGSEVRINRREDWTSSSAAALVMDAGVGAARINGTLALAERDGRTDLAIRLDIDVKLPLVGGRIESLVADLMTQAFTREQAVGREYLAG
jgi:hypothetical protein